MSTRTTRPGKPTSMRSVTIFDAARRARANKTVMDEESRKGAAAHLELNKILTTLPATTAEAIRELVKAMSGAAFMEGRALARSVEYRLIVEEFGLTVDQVIEMHASRTAGE